MTEQTKCIDCGEPVTDGRKVRCDPCHVDWQYEGD